MATSHRNDLEQGEPDLMSQDAHSEISSVSNRGHKRPKIKIISTSSKSKSDGEFKPSRD